MVRKKIAVLASVMILLAEGIIYPAVGVVTGIDYETDIVTVQRANGHVYEFEGVEDILEGDVMALLMYNNLTSDTLTDDVVISARYSGFVADDIR